MQQTAWRVIRCLPRRCRGDHTGAGRWLPELVLLAWAAADSYVMPTGFRKWHVLREKPRNDRSQALLLRWHTEEGSSRK